jgi:putative transposase
MGFIVGREWQRSEIIRLELIIDSWVLMPNYLYGIVWIQADHNHVGATGRSPLRKDNITSGPLKESLGSFIAAFKAASTSAIHQKVGPMSHPIWQRNYYDHIIRDERDLEHHRRYILENPLSWELDQYFNTE